MGREKGLEGIKRGGKKGRVLLTVVSYVCIIGMWNGGYLSLYVMYMIIDP